MVTTGNTKKKRELKKKNISLISLRNSKRSVKLLMFIGKSLNTKEERKRSAFLRMLKIYTKRKRNVDSFTSVQSTTDAKKLKN
jgi:hypothetical protein